MTLGRINPQTDSTLPTLLTRLEPDDSQQLAELCGPFDQHLRQIEQRLGVTISNRGNELKFVGGEEERKAAKALLENGADVNIRSELGGTPLHEAAASASAELIQMLLDAGVDASIVADGGSALDIAKEFKNEAAIRLLKTSK